MNILLVGIPDITIINAIKTSNYLEKFYIASSKSVENIPNIDFESFEDLKEKAKLLKIDIIITFDEDLIKAGITEFLKQHKFAVIAVNKKWFNLQTSRIAAKNLLKFYGINTPEIIKAPMAFPIILKTDKPETNVKIDSLNNLVTEMEKYSEQSFYIEEYMDCESYEFTHLWDGVNLYTFPSTKNMSEVQIMRLNLYSTKMNFMFSDEKVDFIGFFKSKLLWSKNDWYVSRFVMGLDRYSVPADFKRDFLYIINLAMYTKLNELES